MLNTTRPHLGWMKNKLLQWLKRFDVNKALRQERKDGLREGIELGTKYCFMHSERVLKRIVSPGLQACDQCQLDAHVTRYFTEGPQTGPHHLYSPSGLLHIPLPTHGKTGELSSQWAKTKGRTDTQQRRNISLKNANNGYVYGDGKKL